MKKTVIALLSTLAVGGISASYSGKPWQEKMQAIPGRVECEFYDMGGEGVAYHDSDSINNGSGKLNPANGDFLNEFRMREGVDISYTKSHIGLVGSGYGNGIKLGIDDNPYNKVPPAMNQLYVGWTQPGEWINYTVEVKETGTYVVSLMYTANGDGTIAVEVDGQSAAHQLKVISTHEAQDTVAWRQWHHWNRLDALAKIDLKKGVHVLTLRVGEHGNMNFDYLEFKK